MLGSGGEMNKSARRVMRSVALGIAWAVLVTLLFLFSGGGTPFIYIAF